jgi:hypothetical protein
MQRLTNARRQLHTSSQEKLIQLINILKEDNQLRLHYHHDNLKPHKLHYLWSQEGEMNWKGGFENLRPPPLRVPLFSETD